jgi:hypothetical protein
MNSEQLNVDNNLKVNNDLCSEKIPLYTNSEITVENTDNKQSWKLGTEKVITEPTINLKNYYNEVLKDKNTVDSIIDKYLKVTPIKLYYTETRITCLSSCITSNTKTWLSNKILEKCVKNRIMGTVEFQIDGKFNRYIPQELLRKQYIEDFIDVEGMQAYLDV